MSNFNDISDKVDELVSFMHSPHFRVRARPTRLHVREAFEIAGRSDSVFGFITLLSVLRDATPWIYEIGSEAHRQAASGDIARARQVFDELTRIHEITSSVLQTDFIHIDMLRESFEKMIHFYQVGILNDNDIPW